MTFRLVQRGDPPLVVCWLIGPHLDAELRAALPGAAIVATTDAPTNETPHAMAEARLTAGLEPECAVALVGYSAGCQAVRALLIAGDEPRAVVCIDGTHASKPPATWQIDVWRELAAEARRGRVVFVATCTQQLYVERLPQGPFTATRHVLERVVDAELGPGTEVHEQGLHVLSYASADIDADAHRHQQTIVLPDMLRRFVAPQYRRNSAEPPADSNDAPTRPWRMSLGERLVAWYQAERAAGVGEQPSGSNGGPRIAQYFSVCRRRGTEQPLGLTTGPWCAAMASFGLHEVALPGEAYPAPRAAGVELEEDARENGSWRDVDDVLLDKWHPAVGDLVICRRGGGWQRHVCVLLAREAGTTIRTIGGNEGDRIRETARSLEGGTEPIIGFIELARPTPM